MQNICLLLLIIIYFFLAFIKKYFATIQLSIFFSLFLFLYSFFLVLPRTVKISDPKEPFSITRPGQLECTSVGSRPPATITWWKKGKFMGKAIKEEVRGSFSFYSAIRSHIGRSTRISNPGWQLLPVMSRIVEITSSVRPAIHCPIANCVSTQIQQPV